MTHLETKQMFKYIGAVYFIEGEHLHEWVQGYMPSFWECIRYKLPMASDKNIGMRIKKCVLCHKRIEESVYDISH